MFIMRPPKGMVVDHIDGNGLNNRRSNLRICTPQENGRNRRRNRNKATEFKDVAYDPRSGKYFARICVNRKPIHIGTFTSAVEAAKAYDRMALKLHGEFANLNFPDAAAQPREA
jgi:hypothetical protein